MGVTNIPLKWKVILGVTVTSMLSVILSVALFASIETGRLEQSVITESETIAKIIGSNSVGSLAFSDPESGLETPIRRGYIGKLPADLQNSNGLG